MGAGDIRIRPLSGALGAEIFDVDLSKPLEEPIFAAIHRAFLEYKVLGFRDQDLSAEAQLDFARRFGELDIHPIVNGIDAHPELVRVLKPAGESASFGTGWHSDNSFFEHPSLGSCLYGKTIPPFGGDTLFSDMESAYAALSTPLQGFLSTLKAVHGAAQAYDPAIVGENKYQGDAPITYKYSDAIYESFEHPVVRTHPETGRKSLYVNQMFTQHIVGLERAESDALLAFLYQHLARPDFTCRFRWEADSLLVWDNRCVQHYAMDDYQEFERLMFRVTIQGDRPV